MAQIIASIERMEQRRPASRTASPVAQSPDSPSAVESAESAAEELQPQKVSARGMEIQPVATVREGTPEDGEQGQAPRITPKKRWIQLWNAQLHENIAPTSTDSSAAADKEDGVIQTEQPKAEAPVLDHSAADIDMKDVSGDVETQAQLSALAATQTTAATAVTLTSAVVSAVEELRVKTPAVVESSHLSPPLDRNSPTTSASISPSTKVKESAAEEPTAVKAALREAPLSTASSSEPRNRTSSPMPSLESQAEEPETPKEAAPLAETRELQQPLRKRSLERKEPMTEEEQRRADRRRKRKTNWDVGDPRHGSSGETSSALTKFPAGRPSWRHSHSMDTKPYFHTSHRSSFHNHSTSSSSGAPPASSASGRRPFYHSTSLPTEHRSRSLSRPSSTRYNSSSSGSFR